MLVLLQTIPTDIEKKMEKPHKTYSLINEDEPENKRFFYHAEIEIEKARRKVNP